MRALGERFLLGRDAPYEPARGGGLIRMAAEHGDAEAIEIMSILAALGVGQKSDWARALSYLRAAADAGSAQARDQLALIGDASAEQLLEIPPVQRVLETPRVAVIEGFLSPAQCDWLIARASPRLSPARVHDPRDGGRREVDLRTNSGMGFSLLQTGFMLQLIHARIAAALALPVLHQEPTNILHYQPGEQYRAHYDFLNPEEPRFAQQIVAAGQRVATFLIYLNDGYEGGETDFPRANWRFKGRRGDALLFFNVTAEGRPDPLTLHAGTPPSRGEKWLLSKWVRDRSLPLI